MAGVGEDANLQIALTILQFIALALPAVYLFVQAADYKISSTTRQIVRASVISFVIGAVVLLLAIGSNIRLSPVGTYISGNLEGAILLTGLLFVVSGTIHFGVAVITKPRPIEMDNSGFLRHYYRALRMIVLDRIRWRLKD